MSSLRETATPIGFSACERVRLPAKFVSRISAGSWQDFISLVFGETSQISVCFQRFSVIFDGLPEEFQWISADTGWVSTIFDCFSRISADKGDAEIDFRAKK